MAEKNRILTVSRQFGSGGRTIGREVARQLGIPCYDREIVDLSVKKSGFSREYVEQNDEEGTISADAFFTPKGDYYGHTYQDILWDEQRKVIVELAEKGPCVIIGRCADYVLEGKADLLTVFVHADPKIRAERIVREYGERTDSPEKRLRTKDKRRAAYYHVNTDRKWGEPENYHIMLNSGALGIPACVQLLAEAYRVGQS